MKCRSCQTIEAIQLVKKEVRCLRQLSISISHWPNVEALWAFSHLDDYATCWPNNLPHAWWTWSKCIGHIGHVETKRFPNNLSHAWWTWSKHIGHIEHIETKRFPNNLPHAWWTWSKHIGHVETNRYPNNLPHAWWTWSKHIGHIRCIETKRFPSKIEACKGTN